MKFTPQKIIFIGLILFFGIILYQKFRRPETITWRQETLDYYNPFQLRNDPQCPKVPGVFFVYANNTCITYLPSKNNKQEILGNPLYRYSVPLQKQSTGQSTFEIKPEFQELCSNHLKIEYIRSQVEPSFNLEFTAGQALLDLPENTRISPDNDVFCEIILFQRESSANNRV